jgi:hypothetical protein
MNVVLLDMTGGETAADGSRLSPELLTLLAEALTIQMNRDYSAEYGGNHVIRAGTSSADLHEGEWPFVFLPRFLDAPKFVAYHTKSGNGMPLLFESVSSCDTVNGPGNSATVAASHETIETDGDEATNLWVDDGTGKEFARELCDAVEARAYPITTKSGVAIWVSDLVLRAFWVPGRAAPYTLMGKRGSAPDASAPLTTLPGAGYQVTRRADPTSQQSVNGYRVLVEGDPRRRPHVHEFSRKYRRGVRP